MLSSDELRRRIFAARVLRNLDQADLGLLFQQDGLGKHDVGRIERGDMEMRAVHRRALAHHLGVPEAWFTEPDLDKLLRP